MFPLKRKKVYLCKKGKDMYSAKHFNFLFLLAFAFCAIQSFAKPESDCVAETVWGGFTTEVPILNDTSYYEVNTPGKLAWISCRTADEITNINVILTADLDLENKPFIPIAAHANQFFNGIFNGNGHKISNVNIDPVAYSDMVEGCPAKTQDHACIRNIGFIGNFANDDASGETTRVQNLIIEGLKIIIPDGLIAKMVDGSTNISIGGIVGYISGMSIIENCSVSGKIVSKGNQQRIGGLVGHPNMGVLQNNMSAVDITAEGNTVSIGGIVGITSRYSKTNILAFNIYDGSELSVHGNPVYAGAVAGTVTGNNAVLEQNVYDSDEFNDVGHYTSSNYVPDNMGLEDLHTPEAVETLNKAVCDLYAGEWNSDSKECSLGNAYALSEDGSLNYTPIDGIITTTPKTYTITYKKGSDPSDSVKTGKKIHGVTFTLLSTPFSHESYTQVGWSTSVGGDKKFDMGGTYSDDKGLTLYPCWGNIAQSGAVKIYTYAANDHTDAVIDGAYTGPGTIEFPTDVLVNSVEFTREFTENTMSTLMLPFSIDADKVSGGKIYRFKRVDVNGETGVWKVIIGRIYTEQVGANTPYLVLPTAKKMTFEGPVTFNTSTDPIENVYGTETGSTWEYKGVYAHTNFDEVQEDGPMYAFTGQNKDGVKVGQFKKIGTGVKARPMQAYLIDHGRVTLNKSATGNFGHNVALPDVIDIEIEDENGIVVETGKLNTVTGEVRMDRWFDLKGRKLNSKPSVKGTYYKNGKKVIIK
jgi:hypothetical protein